MDASVATTTSVTEEVVFDSSVEGLFRRALGRQMTPRCRARLKEAGLDLETKLRPKYPRTKYYEFVNIAAEELFPGKPREQAHDALGRSFVDGFQETLIGRTVVAMARLLGPKRTLARMTQNMQSSNNYMKTSLVEHAPTRFEITLTQVSGAPGYFRGVLQRAMEIAGAVNPKVTTLEATGPGAVYRVEWDTQAS